MADAAVQFLVTNLVEYISEPITTKIRLFSGDYIEKQKEYLIGEMKDLQKKTQRKQNSNERTKLFARSATDLIYRIEDLVADLNSLMAKSPPVNWLLTDARKVDAEIQEVKDKIDRLSRISLAFDISVEAEAEAENSSSSSEIQTSTAEWSRETYSHQMDEHYVERVEETHLLRSYLTPGGRDTPCRAVFICGMGGIGKTALAKKLYSDLQYDTRFYAVAWVYVSHNFVPRRILEDLYVKLHPYHREQVSEMDDVVLAGRVRDIQQNRTCLVVLDDIWSTDAWETLRAAFPSGGGDTPSKLLITTRVAKMAEAVEREADRRYIHKLRCLTESQSLELFQKMVPQEDVQVFETNEILLEIRRKTVEFCEGLPLAIIRFLQFIATKRTLEERMIVHQSFESLVRKSQENGGAEATLQLLSLSYDNLPHYLRPCFLYLGHFQEDSMIEAEKLYLSWEAEGLISLEDCRREETVKDVAERYLKDLAESSMVEVHEEEVPIITRFKSCQLNKLMRDLCLLKNKELGFFKVVDFERGPQLVPNSYSSGNEAYRLAINLDKYEEGYNFPLEKNEKKHVRCLLLSAKENKKGLVWPRKLSKLAHFQYLKILDFDGFDFQVTKLPRGIEYLLHLRYLSFRGCILPKLPSSIGNLTCLLTLDLRVQSPSEITIPNIIRKLKKLKHLYLPVSFFTSDGGKIGLEGLTELETLINFNPGMINVDDLFQLSKLLYMSLNIAGSIEDIERITERMNKDSDGHTLHTSFKISNFDCYTEEKHSVIRSVLASQSLIIFSIEGHFRWLPLFNKISQNIARIELSGAELIENPMRILEKLPKLRVLVLNDDAFVGKEMVCSEAGFVELKRLELLNLQKLEKWIVEEGAMPKLSILEIGNCGKLKMLPEELQFVCRLQKMKVSGVHKEFKANLRKVYEMMKQDAHRVKNARPIISIDDVQLL